MEISFDNVYAYVDGNLAPKLEVEVVKALSYYQEGYVFTQAYKDGRWDGRMKLITKNKNGYKFPVGLLSTFLSTLKEHQIFDINLNYTLKDLRVRPSKELDLEWCGHELRDYQLEAVSSAIKSSRGVWNIATGGGKMLVAAKLFQELGLPGFILVKTKEAVDDTYNEFTSSIKGCSIGRWDSRKKELGFITISTVASITHQDARKELLDAFSASKVLIVDELHSLAAKTWYNLVLDQKKAYYRIGQTGTYNRQDGKELLLQAATGRLLVKENAKSLQNRGYLAESKIIYINTIAPSHMTEYQILKLSPADQYKETIVNHHIRNRMICSLMDYFKKINMPFVCIIKYQEHGELLAEMSGVPFISGKTPSKQREEAKVLLETGKIGGIIATKIYDESVNIPILTAVINAGGHSAENAQVQRHGRVIRKQAGKTAYFIDFYDISTQRLRKHTNKRIKILKKEGHNIDIIDLIELKNIIK